MVYWMGLGSLFLASAMYAFLIFRSSANDCVAGCPVDLLTPSFKTASACSSIAEGSTPTSSQLTDAYNARCFDCDAANNVRWACASSVPLPECAQSGGVMLNTPACSTLTLTTTNFVKDLETRYGETALGSCVQYLATDVEAEPASVPTGNPPRRATMAELELGPGIQVVVSESISSSNPCSASVMNRSFIAYGELCYNVPRPFTLRALLVPGLLGLMLTFAAQCTCSFLAGCSLCLFRNVRGEQWLRLRALQRYAAACLLRMPACVCVFQMLTGVMVMASLAFIVEGVCLSAPSASGSFAFYPAARTLVQTGTVIWCGACCGRQMRAVVHPDAGLASPESDELTEVPERRFSVGACLQCCCSTMRKFGP